MSGIVQRTITALNVQKRHRERVNVFLDGDYAFSLNLNLAMGLSRGQRLSEAEIKALHRQDEAHRAYLQGLRLLGYRPRSQVEVERRLRQKGYAADAIAAAVERLCRQRYLDDATFARSWMEQRQRTRPRGTRGLNHELRQKGVDKTVIDTLLTDVDEEAAAWTAIEKKLDRWRGLERDAFRKKVMGFLSRRGFGYDVVRTVCHRAWEAVAPSAEA